MARRSIVVAGVLAAILGIATIIEPGLVPLQVGALFVTTVGVLMVLQGGRIVQGSMRSEARTIETPDVELPVRFDRPGDDLQRSYLSFGSAVGGLVPERVRIRSRLREAAQAVVAQTHRLSIEQAGSRVADGSWTDDPDAAAYLGRGRPAGRSLRQALSELVRGAEETRIQESIRRSVNAIGGYLDLPPLGAEEAGRRLEAGREAVELPEDPAADLRLSDRGHGRYLRSDHPTGRWEAVSAIAFAFGGVGVIFDLPGVLLAGVVGLGYAAYANVSTTVDPIVTIDRTVEFEGTPRPGDEIPVELRVTNAGDRALPDLRVVDGVPEGLRVIDGSPRHGTALRPGETATLKYTLRSRRGTHAFRATQLLARPLSGSTERELLVSAPAEITCIPALQPVTTPLPLRERASQFVGNVASRRGGGVEFYATREYRPGDPIGRIDWNRHARTGELATLEFREERAASVVIIVDTRSAAYLGRGAVEEPSEDTSAADDGDNAVERSIAAAGRLAATLLRDGNTVGLASFGPEHYWVAPGLGSDHAVRLEADLGGHSAFSPDPPEGTPQPVRWLRQLRRRLPDDVQIVFLTPLPDDYSVFMARRLDASGFPVTVVSPDPTSDDTLGRRIAFIERRLRVTELRRVGIPVVDWAWDQRFEAALRRAARRRR